MACGGLFPNTFLRGIRTKCTYTLNITRTSVLNLVVCMFQLRRANDSCKNKRLEQPKQFACHLENKVIICISVAPLFSCPVPSFIGHFLVKYHRNTTDLGVKRAFKICAFTYYQELFFNNLPFLAYFKGPLCKI